MMAIHSRGRFANNVKRYTSALARFLVVRTVARAEVFPFVRLTHRSVRVYVDMDVAVDRNIDSSCQLRLLFYAREEKFGQAQ